MCVSSSRLLWHLQKDQFCISSYCVGPLLLSQNITFFLPHLSLWITSQIQRYKLNWLCISKQNLSMLKLYAQFSVLTLHLIQKPRSCILFLYGHCLLCMTQVRKQIQECVGNDRLPVNIVSFSGEIVVVVRQKVSVL